MDCKSSICISCDRVTSGLFAMKEQTIPNPQNDATPGAD